MRSKKLRVALCFKRPLDMEAYGLLVETVAHAKVVVRSTGDGPLAKQVAAAGVNLVLVETGLAQEIADSSLAEMLNSNGTPQVALVEDGQAAGDNLAHLPVVTQKHELVTLLGGEPPTAGGKHNDNLDIESLGITRREREVWQLIAQGLAVREAAETLGLAESTIDSHKSRLMRKLGIHKSLDLVRLAVRLGIVDL
ncbi:LuxR C-terminal-related transcriptional regulator [Aeoliella sp. ICT_H6.2]|uniref:LuxR C-terminal-related transcriptional regulator n=1 Tax=Aeoliella straminimaris TaxID=2954799 RepID=A0A9X2F6W4_9BACT|nr:LuxR C-terminal-related transcriptional regulator [Aeoliella straminimaris]MCO6042783.1 LuxR C-terminal-related transcriptional regulator [Aeoliella straminimaris]